MSRSIHILRYPWGMAQDPEGDEEPSGEGEVDPSPDFDLVPLFSSASIYAEMEATNIHALLEAAGVPSVVMGDAVLPFLSSAFEVRVPRARFDEAERVLEAARAAGPAAAAEAEAATE
ncbi:MAG: hypothetical protein ABSC23_20965 [Bryobacteraceae bacterium]|jgi:hypothetical protein